MHKNQRTRACRRGFSFLELQVAFVLFGIALAGLVPLVVMQSRQLKKIEDRFNHQTTYYVTPSANLWARKLGAAAGIATEDPGALVETGSIFEAHVNFQRLADPAPGTFGGDDYVADAGSVFADRGNGYSYGWDVDITVYAGNRDSPQSADERYDTLNIMQQGASEFTWELAVPDGTYSVRLVAGDAWYFSGDYRINVEDVLIISAQPSGGKRWREGTATVTVTDGRLTVSNAPGAGDNRICFIDVYPGYQVRILSLDRSPVSEEVSANVEVLNR